jgi:hypothetical protein
MDVFLSGTTTPATVYKDSNLTTPHSNPIVASSDGKFPAIFTTPYVQYRFRVRNSSGTPITGYDFDPISTQIQGSDLFPSSIAALQAVPVGTSAVFLNLGSRSGYFRWISGDKSALISSDPLQGLYIPPATDTSGASGCWARVWDEVTGFAEWFGAIPESATSAAINVAALNAALALLPTTQLRAARYYTSDTIIHSTANHRLVGNGFNAFNDSHNIPGVSRIICTSATANILQVGSPSLPTPAPLNFPLGIVVSDVMLDRSVAPNISSNCVGLRATFIIGGTIKNIKSRNSMKGYELAGLVGCVVDRTYAVRDVPGSGSGTDFWDGYDVNGNYNIGTVGGNASLFITKANATNNEGSLQRANSFGMRLYGGLQDLFIEDFEAGICNVGMFIEGGGTNGDIYIKHPILDACNAGGLVIQNAAASAAINVADPYVAMAAGSAGAGYWLNSCHGPVSITGGQILNNSSSICISLENTTAARLQGMIVQSGSGNNVSTMTGCSSCHLEFTAFNSSGSNSTYNVVVIYGPINGCTIKPTVGGSSTYANGINVTVNTDTRNNYDVGGINSANIAGGFASKLIRGGISITTSPTMTPFYSGTNFITGNTG